MFSSISTPLPLRPPPQFQIATVIPSPNRSSIQFPQRQVARVAAAYATAESTCVRSPSKMASSSSLYHVLGISTGASGQEIKSAYRRLARTLHPDVAAIGRKDSSADEFMKIHAAYSTLSDPEKRADYDRRLFRIHRPSVSSEPVFSRYSGGYTGRNWETDQCW